MRCPRAPFLHGQHVLLSDSIRCARHAHAMYPAHLHASLRSLYAGYRRISPTGPLDHLKFVVMVVYSLLGDPCSTSSSRSAEMDTNSDEDELYLHIFFDEVRRSHEPGLCHPSMVPRSLRLASSAAISTPCRLFTRACLTLLMLC